MPTWLVVLISVVATLLWRPFSSGCSPGARRRSSTRSSTSTRSATPQFPRSMEGLLPPAIVGGNRVTALINGDQIFPAMLDAIRAARQTITFETFIYWSGDIGREFADALIERARAGVKVHVLLDWLGSKKMDADSDPAHDRRRRRGRTATTRCAGTPCTGSTTARTASCWSWTGRSASPAASASPTSGRATPRTPTHWRDSHFKVEGPSSRRCRRRSWTTGSRRSSASCTARSTSRSCPRPGSCRAQVFTSSPAEGSESVRLMYLLSITCAARSIRLASAYFVPDDLSVQTLRRRRPSAA